MKDIIYISHPCTSIGDREENRKASKGYAKEFKEQGYHVVNPLDVINPDVDYNEAMRISFELLKICDAIAMCGEWEKSRGCMAEYQHAQENGVAVLD